MKSNIIKTGSNRITIQLEIKLAKGYFYRLRMIRYLIITSILLLFLFSCNNQEKSRMQLGVIDIESSLQNLTCLKTSDFGKTIRYIPLETTDKGLVGNNPIIKVLRNYIVIEAQRCCLLFDKKDGRFIAEIGHFGQDSEAFTDIFSWTDEKEDFLYFERKPNQLVKYDMKGNFCGKVEFSSPPRLASYYLLTDSEIIGYFGAMQTMQTKTQYVLGIFNKEGILKDTVSTFFQRTQIIPEEIRDISQLSPKTLYNSYGMWANSKVLIINYKNDKGQTISLNAARLWRNNENIRFKEDFVDTVYTISKSKLIPSIIFNTGKYHWPAQEATNKNDSKERIFIAGVSENDTIIFFQFVKQFLYNGLYNKKTGETKLGKHSDTIEDDLTHFMPFIPLSMSTSGEFVSLVQVWDVMEWLEKHPEAKDHEKLSFLKELDEDMNPIVILIE